MPRPYSISAITDILANSTSNLIEGLRGRTLPGPSRVTGYMTREAINVLTAITIGGESVVQGGLAQINATVGTSPIVPDNMLFDSFGFGGEEVIVEGQNLTAGALELRVLLFITPLDDVSLQRILQMPGTR